jgi:hypothetical protein
VNLNFAAPKIWALQMGSETQNRDFLENGSNDYACVSVTCGDRIPK